MGEPVHSTAGGWSERQGPMRKARRGSVGATPSYFADRRRRGARRVILARGCCLSVVVATTAILTTQTVLAQDWQPELQAPTGETRGRGDPIIIILPDDLDPAVYGRLAVELDDIDMTAFATTQLGQLVLAPPESLSTGLHLLRLVERGEDGSILERGAWTFEVRHSDLIRDLSLNADLAGELNARVAKRGIDTTSDKITADSGGNAEAAAGDENWRITAQGNYIYNSQPELGIDERNFDIGEYRFDGDIQDEDFYAGVTVGNHDTGIESLIMSAFNRRGISFRAGTTDDRVSATGFVLRTESLIGTRKVLGISDSDERIEGASVSVRPIEALKDNLLLTGVYYDGEGSDGGFGIGTEEVVNEGDGWSVAADSLWFDESLRLRGEFAESHFDFDGKNVGFSKETANAYSFLASFEPLRGATLDGSIFNWTVGFQREQIDTFFQSLANPSLQADREINSAFTNFLWDEFSADLRFDYMYSNVDDYDFLPTDRTIDVNFNGTYSPFVEPNEDGSLPWYGQPFFSVNARVTDINRTDLSEDFPDDDANNLSRSLTLSTGSNYETWSWNASHTIYKFDDQINVFSDTTNNTSSLGAYFLIDDWLTLTPNVQYDVFEDTDLGKTTRTVNLGLNTEITVIPETLTASLSSNMNIQTGDGDTPNSSSLGGEIAWTLRQPDANRLGIALAFNGFVQHTNDDGSNPEADTQYEAFTTLRFSLPVVY